MAEIDELSEKSHNAGAGLVAERQATALIGQSLGKFRNIRVLVDAALSPMDAARRCLMCSRSEEHTSELHSLTGISYAVFCLRSEERRVGKEC